ncbi:MAG TPA: hypothetical protein VFV47_04675, partial [Hyphomicrobiaceae bacterium]|nr:hypothetical protein [Hyphomicrobiaceae bacterium]
DPDKADWSWSDQRLGRIRKLGLEAIAGLVHHGSGPRYTDLLDPAFPRLLARHAERVAERYPWLEDFTPVNEPLTTARFSALYGIWYPHHKTEASFLKALFHQCWATVLSMRSIRRITPSARLIQTEDLGRVFSSHAMTYQAAYENERRWLSFDLLMGRVDRAHPFYQRFVDSGISERLLQAMVDDPCPPDVFGINHYLTSDRYLDDEAEGYPGDAVGGNGQDIYADVAAVRVPDPRLEGQLGLRARLREVWERYRRPLAITEVHNGCTREEQVRWLCDAWSAANRLRTEGVPVQALTIWTLVGAVDWTSMLTKHQGHYEPGPSTHAPHHRVQLPSPGRYANSHPRRGTIIRFWQRQAGGDDPIDIIALSRRCTSLPSSGDGRS